MTSLREASMGSPTPQQQRLLVDTYPLLLVWRTSMAGDQVDPTSPVQEIAPTESFSDQSEQAETCRIGLQSAQGKSSD